MGWNAQKSVLCDITKDTEGDDHTLGSQPLPPLKHEEALKEVF